MSARTPRNGVEELQADVAGAQSFGEFGRREAAAEPLPRIEFSTPPFHGPDPPCRTAPSVSAVVGPFLPPTCAPYAKMITPPGGVNRSIRIAEKALSAIRRGCRLSVTDLEL